MAESMRRRLERAEDERLAPYALRSREASRRYPVGDDRRLFDYRTRFQRDRDRIVYSRAFRRLRQKAQQGILPAYEDHRRNRLTHTLEVAQLARTLGRALDLNEDLIEAIALGHDLGQPAFGSAGERALDDLLSGRLDGRGGPGIGDAGGFWRSWQGLRVVDLIEKRYEHPGLNLTDPVREGIVKSGSEERWPSTAAPGLREGRPPLFEAQTVILADRIASVIQEFDDAMQSGAIDLARVERLGAVARLRSKLGDRYPSRGGRFMKQNVIHRGLVHLLVTGSVVASARHLAQWSDRNAVDSPDAFRKVCDDAVRGDEIAAPPEARGMLDELDAFLGANVRRTRAADRVNGRGRHVLLGLFEAFHSDPLLLDDHVLLRFKEVARVRFLRDLPREAVEREVCERYRPDPRFARLLADHLASMTDVYALAEHAHLMEMGAVPIPGAERLRRERGTLPADEA